MIANEETTGDYEVKDSSANLVRLVEDVLKEAKVYVCSRGLRVTRLNIGIVSELGRCPPSKMRLTLALP